MNEDLKAGDRIKHTIRGEGVIFYIDHSKGWANVTYDEPFKDEYGFTRVNDIGGIKELTKIE